MSVGVFQGHTLSFFFNRFAVFVGSSVHLDSMPVVERFFFVPGWGKLDTELAILEIIFHGSQSP